MRRMADWIGTDRMESRFLGAVVGAALLSYLVSGCTTREIHVAPSPGPPAQQRVTNTAPDADQRTLTARSADPSQTPPSPIKPTGSPTHDAATGPLQLSPEPLGVSRDPAAKKNSRIARHAPVRLTGPAVGTAPLHIAFAVELPPSVLDGADFLWMDNGMWICDQQRGIKILDRPGRHRISVLVVTRDGEEYRGRREVVVLANEPGDPIRATPAPTR